MDEDGIQLQTLKAGEINKTTTTEIRIDEMDMVIEKDGVYSPASKKGDESSRGSSEVYIIEGREGV
jgi:hypothetical protein